MIFIFVNGIAKWKTNVSLSLLHYNISHLCWKAHLMYYNNNSWTMLRYACYEALHVPHLLLFVLGLHPFLFCFFTNERHFYVENVLKMRATSKATGEKNPQHFSSPLFWKGGIILWSSVFFRFIPAFLQHVFGGVREGCGGILFVINVGCYVMMC